MSAARFRRIHERQVVAMLHRAAWGDMRCIRVVIRRSSNSETTSNTNTKEN